jgi:hypothetical protein
MRMPMRHHLTRAEELIVLMSNAASLRLAKPSA